MRYFFQNKTKQLHVLATLRKFGVIRFFTKTPNTRKKFQGTKGWPAWWRAIVMVSEVEVRIPIVDWRPENLSGIQLQSQVRLRGDLSKKLAGFWFWNEHPIVSLSRDDFCAGLETSVTNNNPSPSRVSLPRMIRFHQSTWINLWTWTTELDMMLNKLMRLKLEHDHNSD